MHASSLELLNQIRHSRIAIHPLPVSAEQVEEETRYIPDWYLGQFVVNSALLLQREFGIDVEHGLQGFITTGRQDHDLAAIYAQDIGQKQKTYIRCNHTHRVTEAPVIGAHLLAPGKIPWIQKVRGKRGTGTDMGGDVVDGTYISRELLHADVHIAIVQATMRLRARKTFEAYERKLHLHSMNQTGYPDMTPGVLNILLLSDQEILKHFNPLFASELLTGSEYIRTRRRQFTLAQEERRRRRLHPFLRKFTADLTPLRFQAHSYV